MALAVTFRLDDFPGVVEDFSGASREIARLTLPLKKSTCRPFQSNASFTTLDSATAVAKLRLVVDESRVLGAIDNTIFCGCLPELLPTHASRTTGHLEGTSTDRPILRSRLLPAQPLAKHSRSRSGATLVNQQSMALAILVTIASYLLASLAADAIGILLHLVWTATREAFFLSRSRSLFNWHRSRFSFNWPPSWQACSKP